VRKDNLGDRMKKYENAYRHYLPERMPVLIRIDGCHFHSYTKGMQKPFDKDLANAFWETAKYLAKNINGCKLAYHQSDEITLLLVNYERINTQSWFDNNIQKITSVVASMATVKFNEVMKEKYPEKEPATFDARTWILPQNEVMNAFLWRQNDATRNSISMVGQANFPQKELQNVSSKELQDKLFIEKSINWNKLPVWQKRGVCIRKEEYEKKLPNGSSVTRSRWIVDHDIPIFTKDTEYINQYVYPKKEVITS